MGLKLQTPSRNYEDVCDTIREFMRRGVVIRTVINNFTFDGVNYASTRHARCAHWQTVQHAVASTGNREGVAATKAVSI